MKFGRLLGAVIAALTVVRLVATYRVGFGDSEALYASYALFPAATYRDHPGLIGMLARLFATPEHAPHTVPIHLATTVLAAGIPLLAVYVAHAFGATRDRALACGLVFATVPVAAIGSFAFAPDTLLAPLWLGALGLFAFAVRRAPSSTQAAYAFLGVGLLVGLAALAKVTGVLLVLSLAFAMSTRDARAHVRTPWPWLALALAVILVLPAIRSEAARGLPMLHHRLVATQGGAGISMRNIGAVVGGQLLYLSPPFAFLAVCAAVRLYRCRAPDAPTQALRFAFLLPLVVLVPFCFWSRVAEPHWLLPPLFALPIYVAAHPSADHASPVHAAWPRATRAAVMIGLALTLLVHAWVLVPSHVLLAPKGADLRLDIATELYGWPQTTTRVAEIVASARGDEVGPNADQVVVVGPHWIVCAQLRAGLPTSIPVGCMTPTGDDFDDWLPRAAWQHADVVVYVTDARFSAEPEALLPRFSTVERSTISYAMDGRRVRTFTIVTLRRLVHASR